jgi:aquaporin Z
VLRYLALLHSAASRQRILRNTFMDGKKEVESGNKVSAASIEKHQDEERGAKLQELFDPRPSAPLVQRCVAEGVGTFWLVLGGCGSALIAASFPGLGIGFIGVALAFGLTVLTMAYAVGHLSGGHFNPAVTLGLLSAGRCPARDVAPYIVSQLVGGIIGATILYIIASGHPGFDLSAGFASNGYGEHSPGRYSLIAALLVETVLTFMFLMIILGATDRRAPAGMAPLAIGLALTLIHLVSIPVTNTSVNPARSTATAIFAGGWALLQLWAFWVAPIVGAVLAGVLYPLLYREGQPKLGEAASS